jgi:hypothetical protein
MDERMNMWAYSFSAFLPPPATNCQPHIRAVSLAVLGSAYSHREDGAIFLKNSSAPIVDTLYHNVDFMKSPFIQKDAQGADDCSCHGAMLFGSQVLEHRGGSKALPHLFIPQGLSTMDLQN